MVFKTTIILHSFIWMQSEAILCAFMLLSRNVVNINPNVYNDTAKQKLGCTWLEFHDDITQSSYI